MSIFLSAIFIAADLWSSGIGTLLLMTLYYYDVIDIPAPYLLMESDAPYVVRLVEDFSKVDTLLSSIPNMSAS